MGHTNNFVCKLNFLAPSSIGLKYAEMALFQSDWLARMRRKYIIPDIEIAVQFVAVTVRTKRNETWSDTLASRNRLCRLAAFQKKELLEYFQETVLMTMRLLLGE